MKRTLLAAFFFAACGGDSEPPPNVPLPTMAKPPDAGAVAITPPSPFGYPATRRAAIEGDDYSLADVVLVGGC